MSIKKMGAKSMDASSIKTYLKLFWRIHPKNSKLIKPET